jgi:hypothetical protein
VRIYRKLTYYQGELQPFTCFPQFYQYWALTEPALEEDHRTAFGGLTQRTRFVLT